MSVPTDAVAPRRARVLLTGPVDAQTWHDLSALADVVLAPDAGADTLRRCIADADVLVVRSALPADLLDFAPRLRGIVRHGVGVDMIPMEAATRRGIAVANVPGSNRHAVAEHAIGVLGVLRRRCAQMDATLLVTAPPALHRARVLARPGMTPAQFEAILARQLPDREKRGRATHIIETLGLDAARAAVQALIDYIRSIRHA